MQDDSNRLWLSESGEMELNTATVQQPEVLKYLSGEISFETWLENQENELQTGPRGPQPYSSSNTVFGGTFNNFADVVQTPSIFSSWGSAYSGTHEHMQGEEVDTSDYVYDDDEQDYGEEAEEGEDSDGSEVDDEDVEGDVILDMADTGHAVKWNLTLPSFANVPPLNLKESQIQGAELIPISEMLPHLITTSKIRNKIVNIRKLSLNKTGTGGKSDESLDILTDFQQFQFRKRNHGKGRRTRLPELLRLQMGQANLLVAKGDFKQAANICMEIVREVPSSGVPFKTLAFIYEEQGNKELSLQYSLIAAFLGCKDGQEWRDLAKRCLDAGNRTQALACYDRGCRFACGDISLHWERGNMYFEDQDYKKVVDIYQGIFMLLVPSDQSSYFEVGKKISKLQHKNGLVERAVKTLEIAFNTCPGVEDYEAMNMLCDMLISFKTFKRTIKLITEHCDVRLPNYLCKMTHKNTEKESPGNLEKLNKFIDQAINEDFKDLAAISAEIACVNTENFPKEPLQYSSDRDVESTIQYTDIQAIQNIESLYIPDGLPFDVRVKLCFCLIHSYDCAAVEKIMEPLFFEDIANVGDLLVTIGEAYFDTGRYKEAIRYFNPLVVIEKYNISSIWLMLAEINAHIGNAQECIHAYYKVLKLAPLQASVRLNFASFLRSVGRDEQAITVLKEYEDKHKDCDGDDVTIISDEYVLKVEEYEDWYKKCIHMFSNGKLYDFIYHSYILMHNYLMSSYTYNKKQTVGKALVWELLLKTLKVCMKFKEYRKAIRLVEQALLFRAYAESRKYRLELDYLQTTIYFVAGEYSKSFDSFRNLLTHENENEIQGNAIWNLFAQIVNKMLDKRHHRFTLRLLFKRPKLIPLIIQNGNNSHSTGTYKYAISEFSRAFREWPSYPLNSLLLAVSYLHLSCQKFHETRHTSILHGLIFMFQYFNLRGENQEAYYNVGRAFHQIGLVHFAVHYYNKALGFPLHNEGGNENMQNVSYHPHIDLHREAAFNLSLIYKASGNNELARKTLYRYCWV